MESLYKDRDVRRFIRAGGFFAVCMIITGAFLYYVHMEDVKSLYLQQQAEAAGALLQAGIEPVEAARILGGEIRAEMAEEGRQLMHSAGYEDPLSIRLIPPLRKIGFRWGLCFLIFGGLISLSSGGITYRLLAGQHKKLYEMEQSVRRFMEGDFEQRIPAEDEGDFALLSTAVNEMASSLNAHREAQKKAKDFLQDTITNISHQLKTPLAALFMYQDIIRQDPEEEETVKKFAAKSVKALERMQTLILNLLKMARLDADMIVFRRQNVKVRELLEDIKAELETRAEKEKKEIILTGDETSRMICDRDWMQEAVSNLVKNALDHTKEGGRVEISWEETGVGMRVQVEDNGSGIHPEDMYSIFKRFYRSRFSNDREGAGLGLPLTKAIVEGHGGTVGVDSVPGQGSVFTLFFPDNR